MSKTTYKTDNLSATTFRTMLAEIEGEKNQINEMKKTKNDNYNNSKEQQQHQRTARKPKEQQYTTEQKKINNNNNDNGKIKHNNLPNRWWKWNVC